MDYTAKAAALRTEFARLLATVTPEKFDQGMIGCLEDLQAEIGVAEQVARYVAKAMDPDVRGMAINNLMSSTGSFGSPAASRAWAKLLRNL